MSEQRAELVVSSAGVDIECEVQIDKMIRMPDALGSLIWGRRRRRCS
jgi:hypothetical protein